MIIRELVDNTGMDIAASEVATAVGANEVATGVEASAVAIIVVV